MFRLRLKSIELQGFKSFKNKIQLTFNDPVTAIVGPNGSGKSNISDAMRWVLGETSAKQLRGDRMEDIIFAGTDEERPLNFAEVRMTFENEEGIIPIDYQEVVIRRRVFRTGESEYYINEAQVRLKDIRELFLDTGVGKEGYSIIGQGRIQEILSSRPIERRQIFEEASGIARDQYKKDQSMKRLEKTVDHLTRVRDIIEEQRKRVNFLEEQAKAAEKAKILEEQIKKSDLYYALEEEKSLTEFLKEDRKSLNAFQIRAGILEKEIQSQQEKRDEWVEIEQRKKEELEILQKEERTLFFNKTTKSTEIQQLEESQKIHCERMADWKNSLRESEDKKKSLLEKMVREEEQLESLKKEILEKREEEKNLKTLKDEIEKELSNLNEESQKKEFAKEEIQSEITELVIRKRTAENTSSQQEEDFQSRKEEILSLKSKIRKEEELLKDLQEAKEKLEEEKSSLDRKKEEIEREFEKTKEEDEKAHIRSESLQAHLLETQQRRKFLEEVQENFEGYYYSVRRLLSDIKKSPLEEGLIGTVADSIRVKPGYEKVIDVLLSSRLQNVIVKTGQDAAKLIEYLKEQRIGTCTFLPVDRVSRRPREQAVDSRILAVAIDVVEFDEEIRPVMEHLLNQTVITKDIHEAEALSKSRKTRSRIASLDGDIINTGGSMVGGHRGKSRETGLINRQSELEEIQEKENELIKQKGQLEILLEKIREKKWILEEKRGEILDLLEKNKSNSLENQYKIENQHQILENTRGNLKNLEERMEKLKEENFTEEDEMKLEKLQSSLKELVEEIFILEKEIREKEISFEKTREDLHKSSIFLSVQERDLNLQGNTLLDLKDEKTSLERVILENTEKIKHREKEEIEETKRLEILKKELEEISLKKEKLEEKLPYLEEEWSKLTSELESLRESLYQNEQEETKTHYEIENYKKKCLDSVERRKNLKTRILEDYSIHLEDFVMTEEALSREDLEKLKRKRKNLGFVSDKDIEEYEEAKEEFDFLVVQEEDLVQSKKDTRKIILELDRKMTSSFLKAFREIQESFERIFKILFDGGEAKLFLEEEDALTAGVEIMARPPGKKPQSLNLLSGGEKALTAVALLFAIFETNPSPFCILDEIDASLDEANIGRYCSYLESLTDKTQFIIITHRKRTMETGDKIYGVSMQEEGISSVIPLNLEDYKLEE